MSSPPPVPHDSVRIPWDALSPSVQPVPCVGIRWSWTVAANPRSVQSGNGRASRRHHRRLGPRLQAEAGWDRAGALRGLSAFICARWRWWFTRKPMISRPTQCRRSNRVRRDHKVGVQWLTRNP